MSHYPVLVILPTENGKVAGGCAEDVLALLLDPFDENKQVERYKSYLTAETEKLMRAYYGDDADLVAKMKDWSGSDGGRDEQGLFHWSVYNPASRWDWYMIGGRWKGAIFPDNKDAGLLHDLLPTWDAYAIVTPDGTWHAQGTMGWFAMSHDENPDWDKLRYEIASAFPEHVGVLVDMHI
jgi:hypothetical protein